MNGRSGETTRRGQRGAEIKWILGGRFIRQEAAREITGMTFEGTRMTGYDNLHKTEVDVWMDNFSTAIFFSEGTMDVSGHVLTMYGTMDDPVTGEQNKMVKYVTRFLSPDQFIFEFHDLSRTGSGTMGGEIVYRRKNNRANVTFPLTVRAGDIIFNHYVNSSAPPRISRLRALPG